MTTNEWWVVDSIIFRLQDGFAQIPAERAHRAFKSLSANFFLFDRIRIFKELS